MEGHQRNLYLYDRFNTRVVGVSVDDIITLKSWAKSLDLTFPLLSNVTGFLGAAFGIQPSPEIKGFPVFGRRTVIIDKKGIIRYVRDRSPKYKEILLFLKKLNLEGE
ncbi:MAG: redoxin domain-containing protein [Thermodesulfobacteriota bacterium]